MSFQVVNQCINQDTKETLNPGDIVDNLSDFEKGRLLANGDIINTDKKPPEKRKKRTYRKRNVTN